MEVTLTLSEIQSGVISPEDSREWSVLIFTKPLDEWNLPLFSPAIWYSQIDNDGSAYTVGDRYLVTLTKIEPEVPEEPEPETPEEPEQPE